MNFYKIVISTQLTYFDSWMIMQVIICKTSRVSQKPIVSARIDQTIKHVLICMKIENFKVVFLVSINASHSWKIEYSYATVQDFSSYGYQYTWHNRNVFPTVLIANKMFPNIANIDRNWEIISWDTFLLFIHNKLIRCLFMHILIRGVQDGYGIVGWQPISIKTNHILYKKKKLKLQMQKITIISLVVFYSNQ